jgi:hypothetical protein
MMMIYPEISKDFTSKDIKRIREHNSLRHIKMGPKEIMADAREGAEQILKLLEKK